MAAGSATLDVSLVCGQPKGVSLQGLFRLGLVLATTLAIVPAAAGANEHADYHAVCPGAVADSARCHAQVVTDEISTPLATSAPTGLGPADFASAYKLSPSTGGSGQTIAIVDAYDDPSAESDLGVYSAQYGLPACTTANGCFMKVNQNGGSNPPRPAHGWALEISRRADRPRDLHQMQDPARRGEHELHQRPLDELRRRLQAPGRADHRLLRRQRLRRRMAGGLAVGDGGRRHDAQPELQQHARQRDDLERLRLQQHRAAAGRGQRSDPD